MGQFLAVLWIERRVKLPYNNLFVTISDLYEDGIFFVSPSFRA